MSVCLSSRDDYYNPDTEDKNIAEIIIANRETARSVPCVLRGCHSTLVLETSCVSRIRRYKKKERAALGESACLFSIYKSNKSTGMCSVQLEIAEMLCKSFFEYSAPDYSSHFLFGSPVAGESGCPVYGNVLLPAVLLPGRGSPFLV